MLSSKMQQLLLTGKDGCIDQNNQKQRSQKLALTKKSIPAKALENAELSKVNVKDGVINCIRNCRKLMRDKKEMHLSFS